MSHLCVVPPPNYALVLRHVESSPAADVQSLADEFSTHPSPSPHTELLPSSVQVPAPSRFIHALPLTQAQSLFFPFPRPCVAGLRLTLAGHYQMFLILFGLQRQTHMIYSLS